MSRLLLKARPTAAQLLDRLRDPRPDGLELYLDRVDLIDDAAMDQAVANLEACSLPAGFELLIEGPVRSLDGEFFDLTRDAEADREVVRRLARLARRLEARAVNIHVIAPTAEPSGLTESARQQGLRAGLGLVRGFVEQISASGATATVENMPPVLRMRETGFFYSAIGMPAEDLVWLCEQAPGLRTTLDLSHAGLYINCQKMAGRRSDTPAGGDGACQELFDFVSELPWVESVVDYADALGETLLTCHVANASGLLGEGDPYDRGDLYLDGIIALLTPRTSYFVTETLESNPELAVEMRRALAAMRQIAPAARCA